VYCVVLVTRLPSILQCILSIYFCHTVFHTQHMICTTYNYFTNSFRLFIYDSLFFWYASQMVYFFCYLPAQLSCLVINLGGLSFLVGCSITFQFFFTPSHKTFTDLPTAFLSGNGNSIASITNLKLKKLSDKGMESMNHDIFHLNKSCNILTTCKFHVSMFLTG
jgi:hypothetical protein